MTVFAKSVVNPLKNVCFYPPFEGRFEFPIRLFKAGLLINNEMQKDKQQGVPKFTKDAGEGKVDGGIYCLLFFGEIYPREICFFLVIENFASLILFQYFFFLL